MLISFAQVPVGHLGLLKLYFSDDVFQIAISGGDFSGISIMYNKPNWNHFYHNIADIIIMIATRCLVDRLQII